MGSGSRLALLVQHSFRRISTARAATATTHQLEQQETQYSSAEYGNFDSDLAERAKQLQLRGVGGSAHLNWLLDACACTLSTHSSLASLLSISPPKAGVQSDRADGVLSLLDVCTSLKQMADDADRQLGRLQRGLQSAGQALRAPHIQIHAVVHRLRAACEQLDAIGSNKDRSQAAQAALLRTAKRAEAAALTGSDLLNHALDGTLLMSLLVLTSAHSSFAPRRSGAARSTYKLVDRYCNKISSRAAPAVCTWVAPLRQLQRDLRQEEMGAVFQELQALHTSAASLVATITPDSNINADAVRQGMDSLRKRSQEAQACISTLRSHVASLFQALLALRLALLR